MTSLRLGFGWIVLAGLLVGLFATLASCDSVSTPPEDIENQRPGEADQFRPTAKPASAIADSLDVVSGGGVTRTFPVEAIANAPEAGGEGVLRVSRVDSVAGPGTAQAESGGAALVYSAPSGTIEEETTVNIAYALTFGEARNTGTLQVRLVPNTAPELAANEGVTVVEGETEPITSDLLSFTDGDVDDTPSTLTYTLAQRPNSDRGTLLLGGAVLETNDTFTQEDIDQGRLSYNHIEIIDPSDPGDTFRFTLVDDQGAAPDAAPEGGYTFDITVTADDNLLPIAVNDPGAGNPAIEVPEGNTIDVDVLANDRDPDGDNAALRVAEIVAAPQRGTASINDDSTGVTYEHDGSETSGDTFTYRVRDERGGISEEAATVTITVEGVNDAPEVTRNEGLSVAQEGASTIGTGQLSASDVDNTAAELTYAVTDGPTQGTLLVSGSSATSFTQADIENGDVVYDHTAANDEGDSFTFDLTDPEGAGPTGQTFEITVSGNPPPQVVSPIDDQLLQEGAAFTRDLNDVFSDPEGQQLFFSASSEDATVASAAITGGSTLRVEAEGPGETQITVTASDGNDSTDETFAVAVNAAPVAENDDYATDEDTELEVTAADGVLANDTDANAGDNLTATLVDGSGPSDGTLTLSEDGGFTYAPGADFNGTDGFTYEVSDGQGGADEAAATITVEPVNDPPVVASAIADVTVSAGAAAQTIDLTGVFSDVETPAGDLQFAVTENTDPSVVDPTVDQGAGELQLSFGDPGTADVTVRATDAGGATAEDTFTVTVEGNQVPVAQDDSDTVGEGGQTTTDVLANDSDADGSLDPSTVTITSGPDHGQATVNSSTGAVTYAHDGSETTEDSYTYTVDDDQGATSNEATVSLTVSPVNDAPVADAGQDQTVDVDTEVTLDGSGSSDPEGDPLSYSWQFTSQPQGSGASLSDADTATPTFTADAEGDYVIELAVSDESGASDTDEVTVTAEAQGGGNQPPTVDTNAGLTVQQGSAATITTSQLSASDPDDAAADLTFTVTSAPTQGDLQLNSTTLGNGDTFTQANIAAGNLNYDHTAGDDTDDSFTSDLTDPDDAGPTGVTFEITVTATALPSAQDDTPTTDEDTPVVVDVLSNDDFGGDGPSSSAIEVTSGPTNGTATVQDSGTPNDPTDDQIEYAPAANFNGEDSFGYRITDADGDQATATVTVTVNPINDPPMVDISIPDNLIVLEGQSDLGFDLTVIFSDVEDASSDLVFSATGGDPDVAQAFVDNGADVLVLTFADNVSQDQTVTITVTAEDTGGLTVDVTFSVTVQDNQAPTATDDSDITTEDTATTTDVLANDSDADGSLDPATVAVAAQPSDGTTSVNATTGEITYTPDTGFTGTDSYTYTVDDDQGATSNAATVTITVNAANQAPTATDDSDDTAEDTATTTDVLANDSDADGTLDPATVAVATQPSDGTVAVENDGSITYTPDTGFTGTDSYTYTVDDDQGATSNEATVTITVSASNQPPTVDTNAGLTVTEGDADTPVTTSELSASDPDGDTPLTFTVTAAPTQGDLQLNGTTLSADDTFTQANIEADGLTYDHTAGNDTDDSFTFDLTDPDGDGPDGQTFNITVDAGNQAPTVDTNAGLTVTEGDADTPVTTSELSASDPDGDTPLTFTVTAAPTQGDLQLNGATLGNGDTFTQADIEAGNLDYDHTAATADNDSFTFDLTDPDGAGPTGQAFDITVDAGNQAPSGAFITTWQTTSSGESITIPTRGTGVTDYDFTIDWGDGTVETITGDDPDPSHPYAASGTYTVTISGTFPHFYLNDPSDFDPNSNKLQSIEQWGDIQWESMNSAFAGAENMVYNATDAPDLSAVTDMRRMFQGAISFNGAIGGWDVLGVTNMRFMFADAISFNQDIGGWDVSGVADMGDMFAGASAFNQDIGGWDVSGVTFMDRMFRIATSFDQDIGGWDVSNVALFSGFLQFAGLSAANYDALLIGWEQLDLVDGLSFDAGSSQYTSAAASARQAIIDDDGWSISDGGPTGN